MPPTDNARAAAEVVVEAAVSKTLASSSFSTLQTEDNLEARLKLCAREAVYSFMRDHMPSPDTHAAKVGTPAARWREEGKPDPHGDNYARERAQLCGGHLTDDDVAFQTAMLMRSDLNHEAVLETAKDRIRWLSRKLAALAPTPQPAVAEDALSALIEAAQPFADVADEYHDSDFDTHEVWIDAGPQALIRSSFELRKYRAVRSAIAAIRQTALLGTREAK